MLRRDGGDVSDQGRAAARPNDIKLGEIGGSPFYVDDEQYERWGDPRSSSTWRPGAAGGFSLEGLEDVHFVTRSPTGPAR